MSNLANLIFIFDAKYLYLIIIIISFTWFLTQPKPKQREILIITCICLPLILIISGIASHLYYNPRPFVLGHFKPLIPHKADNGFPSHHMLLASIGPAIIFLFDRQRLILAGSDNSLLPAFSGGAVRCRSWLCHVANRRKSLRDDSWTRTNRIEPSESGPSL